MNNTPETKKHPFIEYLEKHAEDRAMLAELRRGLGRMPGEASGMFPYVVPFIQSPYEEADLYLIASLFALHPASIPYGNFGGHLRTVADSAGDDVATTRRFVQLLRQQRESIDSPLRQHISLLKSQEIAVNWHQLLFDLRQWEHPDHYVQKQWAGSYWRLSAKK